MQHVRSAIHFSPSDLNRFLECEHLITLDRTLTVRGPRHRDPHAELLAAKGLEHERAWLRRFASEGRRIVEIEPLSARSEAASSPVAADWEKAAAQTEEAMRGSADVIYQGVFVDGDWHGIADFLVKVEAPSALGNWSYEAWDAKLARHARPYFLLQLCFYSGQLERIQGVAPDWMVVVPGTSEPQRMRYRDFDAYYSAVRQRFLVPLAERAQQVERVVTRAVVEVAVVVVREGRPGGILLGQRLHPCLSICARSSERTKPDPPFGRRSMIAAAALRGKGKTPRPRSARPEEPAGDGSHK